MPTLILNDTRRDACRLHLGCRTVMENLHALCRRNGREVVASLTRVDAVDTDEFRAALEECDEVIVNGEGTMHHDAPGARHLSRAIIAAKSAGKRTALVNTVWQDNVAVNECLPAIDFIHARDSFSGRELAAAGASGVIVAPDLCFLQLEQTQAPALSRRPACIVADSVQEPVTRTLYGFAERHRLHFRVMQTWAGRPGIGMHPIARSRFLSREDLSPDTVLISGRFHAACLAIKHGVPFLVLPSNTHKIEALLRDADLPASDFMLEAGWEAMDSDRLAERALAVLRKHESRCRAFAREANDRILRMFATLASVSEPARATA